MDQLSDPQLAAAWRALKAADAQVGWNSIQLDSDAPCVLRAGRHFPGNEEAVLVGFRSAVVPDAAQLPQGRGFSLTRVDPKADPDVKTWICLARRAAGGQEIFEMMANDVVAALDVKPRITENKALTLFLGRLRAWQAFMQRDSALLSAAEEIGLFGELVFLQLLLPAGIDPLVVCESWKGPLDGLQDFAVGNGAFEVKSSIGEGAFVAAVGCLDQLDCALVTPLYLVAVRLRLSSSGASLPDQVTKIRSSFAGTPALQLFNELLIRTGYTDLCAEQYSRRFECVNTRIVAVDNHFPKLTRGNVDQAICEARYSVDVDQVKHGDITLNAALSSLGAI